MEKIKVSFMGGQSRYGAKAVSYMLAKINDNIELYAEIEVPCDKEDEMFGYDELKDQITAQAEAIGLSESDLNFR